MTPKLSSRKTLTLDAAPLPWGSMNAPRCEADMNDNGHASDCPCESCMPAGADGSADDAFDAALAAATASLAKGGTRGAFVVDRSAPTVRVTWTSTHGSARRIDLQALHCAARALQTAGIAADVFATTLYVG